MAKIIPFPIERMKDRVVTKSVIDNFTPQDVVGLCGFCNRSFTMKITPNEIEEIEGFMRETERSPLCPECSDNPLVLLDNVVDLFGFKFIRV